MSAEVKKCPFCGGKARHCADMSDHWFKCSSCDCIGPTFKSEDKALAAWNRRATVSMEVAQKLADATRRVIQISDRDHDAWNEAKAALAAFNREKGGQG